MKFATFLMQTSPSGLAAVAKKAEELDYESLWIPEHILMPIEYQSRYPYGTGRLAAPPETPRDLQSPATSCRRSDRWA